MRTKMQWKTDDKKKIQREKQKKKKSEAEYNSDVKWQWRKEKKNVQKRNWKKEENLGRTKLLPYGLY